MKYELINLDTNAKTVKGQKVGFMTAILYLAPWKLSGYNVCAMAEIAGCIGDCLNTAGRGGMAPADAETVTIDGHTIKLNAVQKARIRRTRFFFENREAFLIQLCKEISHARAYAAKRGYTLVVRLNGTSDLRWENVFMASNNNATLFDVFSDLQFYDYTKIPNRSIKHITNYHLTYSYSNRKEFAKYIERAMAFYGRTINFAAVFKGKKMPAMFMNRMVINGDESDLRFLDKKGVVVGLIAKGKAKKSTSGFCVEEMAA